MIRKKEKCPGLREQSQGHKDKITAISLAETGGKVNGKLEPIEAHEKSAAGEEDPPCGIIGAKNKRTRQKLKKYAGNGV